MFEGYIAAKFANKMFEKDVFKIVKKHAFWGALLMILPLWGFGTLIYIAVLWHMYNAIAEKVGISFKDNFWKLVGLGIIVNIIVAFLIDLFLSLLFFLKPFLIYFQFYFSGKAYVEALKKM